MFAQDQTELFQLPAPEIEVYDNHTKIILFAHKEFSRMSKEERQHACLKRVNREYMTNYSLRERFSIALRNSAMISRLLTECCDKNLIKIADEYIAQKNRRYVPFWA